MYTINWGDATAVQVVSVPPGNSTRSGVDHIYTAPGTHAAQVTATVAEGATCSVSTHSLVIKTVEMRGTTLAVGGTPGNDTITLSPADAVGTIAVTINGKAQGHFHPTGHILVYGQPGNDTIRLASQTINGVVTYITVPALLYGGSGTDVLDAGGSRANKVLLGGGGPSVSVRRFAFLTAVV
jgi:hypothetical protein